MESKTIIIWEQSWKKAKKVNGSDGFWFERKIFALSFLFAWYDIWIGAFWDKKKKWLYILPLPTIGLILKFKI